MGDITSDMIGTDSMPIIGTPPLPVPTAIAASIAATMNAGSNSLITRSARC